MHPLATQTPPPDSARRMSRVDEHGLSDLRARYLEPSALLLLIEQFVRLLLRLGVGVGKSHGVDQLLLDPSTYDRFDLVVYVAPTWAVIDERTAVKSPQACPVPSRVIRGRPAKRCGPLAERWSRLERQMCIAYAKATLCGTCAQRTKSRNRCTWPDQFRDLSGVKLVFMTEQQLMMNRSLLRLLFDLAGAQRPLVVLDEARFLDKPFEMALPIGQLRQFRASLQTAQLSEKHERHRQSWIDDLDDLIATDEEGLNSGSLELPNVVLDRACSLQEQGIDTFGNDYHYTAYALSALKYSLLRRAPRGTSRRA